MSEANVIFTLNGANLIIQCTTEDKLRDICQKYSTLIKEKMNSLLFLYRENQINFELSFKDQASPIDINKHEMKILVYKFNCSECNEKNNLNKEKLNEIISNNNKIEDSINEIKLKMDNIIITSSKNPLNIQLKNINNMLSNVNEDIKKNNKEIKNLFGDYINIKNISHPIKISSNYGTNKNLFGNIKSIFFSKILFSHLNERIKLKIIKYNKNLQNKIGIKLINYKLFKGAYINYEEEGKGKEYYAWDNKLRFEGEYLNGERNGKGKEYTDGRLYFEGEYLKGKRNGKGKEYFYNGNLMFDGEYKDGNKWNGKGYDGLNNVVYELKNGNGRVKEYEDGELIFEGEYLNGERFKWESKW